MPFAAIILGLLVTAVSTAMWWNTSEAEIPQHDAAVSILAQGENGLPTNGNGDEPTLVGAAINAVADDTVGGPIELAATGKESALQALADRQAAQTEQVPLQPIPNIDFAQQIGEFTKTYCIDCHGPDAQEGGLELHNFDSVESMRERRKTWKHLSQLVTISAMPPVDLPQPSEEERQRFVQTVELALNYVDCSQVPDPGRETIRRLNRNEYNNTIRDLVGLDLNLAKDFPTDDVGEGFDNIGDVLSLSPILFEKYIEAAERVTDEAILDEMANSPHHERWQGEDLEGSGAANLQGKETWAMASKGSVKAKFKNYVEDHYELRVEAEAQQAGPDLARLEITLDGQPVGHVDIEGERQTKEYHVPLPLVPAGEHHLEVAFVNDYYNPKSDDPKLKGDRNAYLTKVEIAGTQPVPFDRLPESHRNIIFCRPDETSSPQDCARRIMSRFASRAFRRPVRNDEVERLVELVTMTMAEGESFEKGIQHAVQATLVSPHFLFRVEIDRHPDDPSLARKIDDYELASRLSYFLWSSMPDDELFSLAEKNQLHYQTVLESQIKRMLRDKKADALVENFGGQWLNLRNLDEIFPSKKVFEGFNQLLRSDMRKETETFFAYVMREDLPLSTLLEGEFTFLNKRLAEHYGLPHDNLNNDKFEKVSLTEQPRRGVLTHASILMLTSNPNRTAPVKRGKWILENILGEEPPPPPPGVPELEEKGKGKKKLSLREKLAAHRADPGCASCHNQLDPLGFGLENFNAIGQWREKDGEHPVDGSGVLPTGETFNGPIELISILSGRKEPFRELMAEKMLTYALGRGLEVYDQCAIQEITNHLNKNDDRFSALVTAIVNSDPFQKRRGEGEQK